MSCSLKKTPAEETYEECISCKEQTAVLKATPIDEREYYIRGCGQLCPECYRKISKPDNAGKDGK
ncbi:MAG: hypothetical protein HFE30_03865 [Clostridiales bacterium]|nr:hypothetical protein [Clostridiales bacterium]